MLYRDPEMRVILMDYISQEYANEDYYVALEAQYASNDRRADVLLINEYTHAFEIKSDVDSISRLSEQMEDYRRTFDYLTIVTTATHQKKVKKMLGQNDGLMLISDGKISISKEAKINKRISKKSLVSLCSKKALTGILGLPNSAYLQNEVEAIAEKKLSLMRLKEIAFAELERRFKNRYKVFLEEACPPYRECDLSVLKSGDLLNLTLLAA